MRHDAGQKSAGLPEFADDAINRTSMRMSISRGARAGGRLFPVWPSGFRLSLAPAVFRTLAIDLTFVDLPQKVGLILGDDIGDFNSSAFSAVMEALSRTEDLAHSTLRPRSGDRFYVAAAEVFEFLLHHVHRFSRRGTHRNGGAPRQRCLV